MQIALQTALFVLLAPSTAVAACFDEDHSVPTEYRASAAVLSGVVVSAQMLPSTDDDAPGAFDGIYYKIQVIHSYRGPFRSTVTIYSENSSGRFPMDVGSNYIVFLDKRGNHLAADNCGNSGLLEENQKVVTVVERLQRSK